MGKCVRSGSPRALAVAAIAAVGILQFHVTAAPPVGPPTGAAAGQGNQRSPSSSVRRVNALIVSGGGYHDYPGQAHLLMDAIGKTLPVDWTVTVQGGGGTTGHLPVFEKADWAKGFDIVVHNQCFADTTDLDLIRRITTAHKNGVPAMVIHCAMHTFRALKADDWREFLGVTTRRHTRQFKIPVKLVAKDHSILKGFKEDWVTPSDELYVIDKFWPSSRVIASAVSPEDQKEYPLVWTSDYHGARVFGTTLGHGNATFEDPVFQDLLARGFKWALRGE